MQLSLLHLTFGCIYNLASSVRCQPYKVLVSDVQIALTPLVSVLWTERGTLPDVYGIVRHIARCISAVWLLSTRPVELYIVCRLECS